MPTITELIESAISDFGSETKLAAAAGVTQASINEAKRKGRVGPRMAMGIEKATEGKITRSVLRPDLWPPSDAA